MRGLALRYTRCSLIMTLHSSPSYMLMKVPSISQLINGSGGDRCGEACLSACLQAVNERVSMLDVVHYLNLPVNDALSTINQLCIAAQHYGLTTEILNSRDDCELALQHHNYVIVECYNGYLSPLPYPSNPGWLGNHFIVWEGYSHTQASIMDPLAYPGDQHRIITLPSLIKAIEACPEKAWGLSLNKTSQQNSSLGPKKL